jgi:hypothetical protein
MLLQMNICCVSLDKSCTKLYDTNIPWEASQAHTEQNFMSFLFKRHHGIQ